MANGPFVLLPHGEVGTGKNVLNNKHPHAKRRGRVRPTAKGGKGAGQKEYNPDTKIEEATGEALWKLHPVRYRGNVEFGVAVYYDTHSNVDLDNLIKHIWDSMNGRWWRDDGQITRVLETEIHYDKHNPRAEVFIGEIPPDEVLRSGMMPRGTNWNPDHDPLGPVDSKGKPVPHLTVEEWREGKRNPYSTASE